MSRLKIIFPILSSRNDLDYELYFEYATLPLDEYEKIPKRAVDIAKILPELQDYDALRRWQYLSNFLNSYYWELKRGTDILYMIPRGSDRVAEV